MRFINHKLPRLKDISRPAAWSVMTFGIFNLLLGQSLFFIHAKANFFFLINSFLTYQVWGAIFFLMGVLMIGSYLFNHWWLMKQSFVAALFIKLVWAIALILRQINAPGTNTFLILLWVTLAVLQIGAYLYFPTYNETHGKNPVGTLNIPKEIIK